MLRLPGSHATQLSRSLSICLSGESRNPGFSCAMLVTETCVVVSSLADIAPASCSLKVGHPQFFVALFESLNEGSQGSSSPTVHHLVTGGVYHTGCRIRFGVGELSQRPTFPNGPTLRTPKDNSQRYLGRSDDACERNPPAHSS